MADWELHRQIDSDSNGYERFYDPVGGAAVVYEHADRRECEVYINGQRIQEWRDGAARDIAWPDTAALYDGDHGRPVAYRVRYEQGHWYLYGYIYSGGRNRSDWSKEIL